MGTKTVRLDEDVYERIKAKKREDETFSETVERLTSDWSLLDYDTGRSDEEVEQHREAIEASEQAGREKTDEMLERMGVDAEE